MIKNLQACIKVQERRVAQKKRGYSKAVRRYLMKHYGHDPKLLNEWKATLPVIWSFTPEQQLARKKKQEQDDQWHMQLKQAVAHYTGVII